MENQELTEKIAEILNRWKMGESLTNADYALYIKEARRVCAFMGSDPIYLLTSRNISQVADQMEMYLRERILQGKDITRSGKIVDAITGVDVDQS